MSLSEPAIAPLGEAVCNTELFRRLARTMGLSDDARPGVVVGLSIWWPKHCPGGRNANAVTSQELADLGGGASFYDVLVEVEPAATG